MQQVINKIKIVQADITKQVVDAIVNAANTRLLGGGGVDGAIHRAAGPKLLEECKKLNGVKTGEAKVTKGYDLQAKWIIHTAGPVWHGGNKNEEKLLQSSYKNSLLQAKKLKVKTIAFPSISTGVYRFPVDMAAKIAMKEIYLALCNNENLQRIVFCTFSSSDYSCYKNALEIFEKEVS